MGTKRVGWARIKSLINENQNQLKVLKPEIIAVSGTRTLTAAESGATIAWTLGSTHHITLPSATVGLRYNFVIQKGANAAHTIISQAADKIHGSAIVGEHDTLGGCNSQFIADTSGVDKVHWKGDGTAVGGQAGDTCALICVEVGKWTASIRQTTSNTVAGAVTPLAA
tara:strand:- start:117 stop:620 length:504 start_codon:yes stop_codon:yes gene_type:complete